MYFASVFDAGAMAILITAAQAHPLHASLHGQLLVLSHLKERTRVNTAEVCYKLAELEPRGGYQANNDYFAPMSSSVQELPTARMAIGAVALRR